MVKQDFLWHSQHVRSVYRVVIEAVSKKIRLQVTQITDIKRTSELIVLAASYCLIQSTQVQLSLSIKKARPLRGIWYRSPQSSFCFVGGIFLRYFPQLGIEVCVGWCEFFWVFEWTTKVVSFVITKQVEVTVTRFLYVFVMNGNWWKQAEQVLSPLTGE